jgi:hypothetical protein
VDQTGGARSAASKIRDAVVLAGTERGVMVGAMVAGTERSMSRSMHAMVLRELRLVGSGGVGQFVMRRHRNAGLIARRYRHIDRWLQVGDGG